MKEKEAVLPGFACLGIHRGDIPFKMRVRAASQISCLKTHKNAEWE
jgi:hypothetical protein